MQMKVYILITLTLALAVSQPCSPNMINCSECSSQSNTTCTVCKENFFDPSNRCTSSCSDLFSKCAICNTEGTYCKQCEGVLKWNDVSKNCIQWDDNCQHYDQQDKCSGCKQNYIYNDASGLCISPIPHCSEYTNTNTCKTCETDYLPSQKENGQSCIHNVGCSYLNEKDVCKYCKQGYQFNQSTLSCFPIIDNCSKYNDQNECTKCQDGYVLQQKTCQKIQTIDHCVEYIDTNTCKTCETDFLPSRSDNGKSCIHKVGCSSINEVDVCKECRDGYKFNTSNQTCFLIIQRCISYDDKNQCKQCESGYELEQQICKQISIQNCKEYDANNGCKTCDKDYLPSKLNQQKTCIKKVGCSYINEVDVCKDCYDDYQLNQQSNICIKKIENCTLHNDKLLCEKCLPNYAVSITQKSCVKMQENCETYNDQGCEKCIDGHTHSRKEYPNQCIPKNQLVEYCDEYEKSPNSDPNNVKYTCTKCKENYIILDGTQVCIKTIPNCLKYSPNGYCQECQPQYNLSQDKFTCEATTQSGNIHTFYLSIMFAIMFALFA